jgi:molybdopterin-guanine dinucleotide biosynthesis protein A
LANAQPRSDRLAGLVLAGGRANRFGAEKALALLGRQSLLSRAVAALAFATPNIAVSAPAGSETEIRALATDLPVVRDRGAFARVGPLAGVLSGLEWARSLRADWLVTLPCDVVFVPADALEALVQMPRAAYVATKRGAESLCALWPVSCAAMLEQALSQGDHPPVRDFLRTLNATEVFVEGDDVFFNINTREDLARAEAILSRA